MLHFFGILSPGFGKRTPSEDAPGKTDFFGGAPMSRAEQDACFLTDRLPEPAEEDQNPAPRFVRFRLPGRL